MLPLGGFYVYATNAANEKGEQKVILQFIDVNNKPPVFTNIPFTTNITEDAPIDSKLYTVNYVDKDDGINQQTEMTLSSGNEEGKFRIENGKISLNQSLDYDYGTRQYNLNITARNTQPPHLYTSGILIINVLNVDDLGLEFEKSYNGQVNKDSPIGTPIIQVQARDLDKLGENIEYQIFPDSNPGNLFAINSSTGQITVNGELEVGNRLLIVKAISKRNCFVIASVNVTVKDNEKNSENKETIDYGKDPIVIICITIILALFVVILMGTFFFIKLSRQKDNSDDKIRNIAREGILNMSTIQAPSPSLNLVSETPHSTETADDYSYPYEIPELDTEHDASTSASRTGHYEQLKLAEITTHQYQSLQDISQRQ